MNTKRAVIILAAIIALIVAGAIAWIVAVAIPAGARTTPPPRCTSTDGMCDVIEYILVQRNGVHQVWTCFLTRPPAPEGQGVAFGAYTCKRP